MTTTPSLWRGPITDNATDNGFQQDSGVVATTSADTFDAVWRDSGNFNSGHSAIVGRAFDSLGNPTGGDVVLNPLNNAFGVPFNASQPAATPLPIAGQSNGLAVAFTDNFNNGPDFDVYVVRTNASLSRLENPLLIDGSTSVTNDPSVTSFADGGLVVSYTIQNSTTDWDILARTVSAAGVVGPVITLFNDTDRSDLSDLATLKNGNFVAVFESQFLGSPTDLDVFFTIKTENGTNVVSPTTVVGAGSTATETNPHVAALANGGFVVTWTDSAGDVNGTSQGIRATVYDANGNVVTGDILVNQFNQAGTQLSNDVTALPDGGFAVMWEDVAAGVDRVQRFDSAGNLVGVPTTVSNLATLDVNAATLADGRSIYTINDFSSGNNNTVSTILDTRMTTANQVTGANFVGPGGSAGDILLSRNINGTQELTALQIDNGNISQALSLGTIPLNQGIVGTGDFNHDGLSHLLIQADSGTTRTLFVDTMTPGGGHTQFTLGPVGQDTVIDAVGDFNGDGTSDILVHSDNGGIRTLSVDQVSNAQVVGATTLGAVGTAVQIDGAGDFNGDGTSDILDHQIVNGVENLTILTMQNGLVQSATSLGGVGSDFQVDGIGDFNGDGTADILLHHDTGGVRDLDILTVRDNAVVSFTDLGAIGLNLQVDGVGDFNSDGTTDIALHSDSGSTRTYFLDLVSNNTVVASHNLGGTGIDFTPS
jgi:hypothetical protein